MSLIPGDLVSDLDLVALDSRALSDFGDGNATLDDKRHVAVHEWLRPKLEQHGYPAHLHRSRKTPDAVYGQVSSAVTDYTVAASDVTVDDIPLGTIFTGVTATNALAVMYRQPFRGLSVGMDTAVNAVAVASSPTVWAGAWTGVSSLVDGTKSGSTSFAKGGAITYKPPDTWLPRTYANTWGYWATLFVSSLTSTTAATQCLAIVGSRLSYPVRLYTLGLVYQDAWASARGDWESKSDRLFGMAETELEKVLPLIADEFDIDQTGAVAPTEINSVLQAYDVDRLTTWARG
jgi:hypothetical protein